ncbi:MAG: FAD:protein FMN transferase [Silicimonas sp.]|nr:FAD:protein FMN transferase [Silicimonas sp.]
MPLMLMACKPGDPIFEITGMTMGTTYKVVAADASRNLREGEVRGAINAALQTVNAQMSNWDAGSEISRFNAKAGGEAMTLSPELAEVMNAAEEVYRASEGRFDTTMGPLIELWGFGAPGEQAMPSDDAIRAAQARSGHANTLKLGGNAMAKTQDDTQVYLAAIGKGFGADAVGRALEGLGIKDYMIEIGGDLYASGKNPDGMPWQIGIETPDATNRAVLDVIGVSNMGLASSGDYRNYFERDGQRYSHVIDPATGHPITHRTASATVLAENAMLADAWATAMLILGQERGMEIAEAQNLAVLFVERDAEASELRFKSRASRAFAAKTS